MEIPLDITRFIQRYRPDVIREAMDSLTNSSTPTPEGIDAILSISENIGKTKSDGKLLFIAAFLLLFDKRVMLIDYSLRQGYRSIISCRLSMSCESVSRQVSIAKFQYKNINVFAKRVTAVLEQYRNMIQQGEL